MAFSPPVVGCLVKKGLQKGGHGRPRTPPWLRPCTPGVQWHHSKLQEWTPLLVKIINITAKDLDGKYLTCPSSIKIVVHLKEKPAIRRPFCFCGGGKGTKTKGTPDSRLLKEPSLHRNIVWTIFSLTVLCHWSIKNSSNMKLYTPWTMFPWAVYSLAVNFTQLWILEVLLNWIIN